MTTPREKLLAYEALEAAIASGDARAKLNAMERVEALNPQEDPKKASGEFFSVGELPEFDMPLQSDNTINAMMSGQGLQGMTSNTGRHIATALGLMTTFDDGREVSVLKKNWPKLKFMKDQNEDIIVDGRAYGGNVGWLNAPGISERDVLDAGFQISAFTPAGRAGGAFMSAPARIAAVGGSAGVTQTGLDLANQAAGGTDDVSMGNVELADVALATAFGGGFEIIAPALGSIARQAFPAWSRSPATVTPTIKEEFRRVAAEAGKNPDDITDEFVQRWMHAANDAVDDASVPAIKDSDEFGIRYTRGQATGQNAQLNMEDSLRQGSFGDRAQTTMQNFADNVQTPSIQKAVTTEQARLSGGKPVVDTVTEAGDVVREGIKGRAGTLDEAIDLAYDEVGDSFLSPDGMKGLMQAIKRRARTVEFDKGLKQTKSVLKEVDEFGKMLDKVKTLRPFHIQKIEQMRRRLATKINAAENNSDRRQVTQLKAAFDEYLDAAVDGALFSGDEGALAALKKARSLRAEYGKKFGVNNIRTRSGRTERDQTGVIIERMVSADPTAEQTVNYFFGATKLGGKQAGAKLAKHIKGVVGEDSLEWLALREAAFMKLTAKNANAAATSGRQMATKIDDALTNAPTLMKTLFNDAEILQMQRLANAIKRAQPDRVNPSNTANKLSQLMQQAWSGAAQSLGFATGGVGGALGARATTEVGAEVGSRLASRQAQRAVQGPLRSMRRMPTTAIMAPAGVEGTIPEGGYKAPGALWDAIGQ